MSKESCRVTIETSNYYRWLDDLSAEDLEAFEEEQAYYDRKTHELEDRVD